MNVDSTYREPADPSSEEWLQYYRDAKKRRRSRPASLSTRKRLKKWRNRQRAMFLSGFVAVGAIVAVFYAVLAR